MKSMIKQFIRKEIENKVVGANVVDAAFNSSISSASECYSLMPAIQEGTDGHQRLGDKVRPKYMVVRGTIQWDHGYVSTSQTAPTTVRLMILTQKNLKVGTDVASRADVAHLLKDNIGTDVARPYSGGAYDNFAPINTELFKVYADKQYHLKTTYENNFATAGVSYGTQNTHSFSIKIKCPASFSFDDGNGNYPNNFAPFLCLGAVCDDGQAPFALPAIRLRAQSVITFEDA